MKNKSLVIRSAILAAAAAGFSSQLQAAGFALIENSASGQGNAFAGAAAIANDASTIWFNPAGMMRLKNDQIVAAVHVITPDSSFNNGNTVSGPVPVTGVAPINGPNDDAGVNAVVPNFYYVTTIDENLKFGVGVNAPFGLATEYNRNWVGRYHAVKTELKTININPSIAFKTSEKLSFGAGINIMLADVTLTSAVDFGALNPLTGGSGAQDGFADLTGDNFDELAYGINLGLMYEPRPGTRVGLAYRSRVTIDIEGDANFTVPAAFAGAFPSGVFQDQGLSASVTLPDTLSLSFASDADKVTLLGDITWTGWSSFDELRISYDNTNQPDSVTTEAWEDTIRLSLGADYRLSDKMTVRGGWAYDETPIPSAERTTARIPGNTRRWLSAGFSYALDTSMTIDVGYSHLFISDTPINNTFETSSPTTAGLRGTLNGNYNASVDILSLQLTWNL